MLSATASVAQLAEYRISFARSQVRFPDGRPKAAFFPNRFRSGLKDVLTLEIFLYHKAYQIAYPEHQLGDP